MAFGDSQPRGIRIKSKRRAPRMNCRVPVSIEWNARPDSRNSDTGFTRVVNAYGCLLVSPQEAGLQQKLRVTNLVTKQAADAVVVWKGTQRPDGWDLGVELVGADLDFWGIEF